jgi:eukaryotic-like serine/threonine-protein kinase
MTDYTQSERSIFLKALELPSQGRRDTYLQEACAENDQLLDRVRFLLDKHGQDRGPLDSPPVVAPTVDMPSAIECPGTQIGPYKLREQIGEGGFGVVYVAQQSKPVRRKVALKIIKPGMDTRDVIARFEAERQALALMDHPNIAKVLDAGSTGENPKSGAISSKSEIRNPKEIRSKKSEAQKLAVDSDLDIRNSDLELPSDFGFRNSDFRAAGRPYFVMELVRGIPITEFCDEQRLATPERLRLFVDVCRAVQHAHQKGIIHRDLKPSNIMVTLDDNRPIPKVIDFGISKALSQQLTENSVYTAYGQMIGTPLYMAPEQAQLTMRDVDTRSDVYSLGVLLYELLTGTTPFDKETLQKSGFEEMRRIIREVEPPRPSARISTLRAEMLSTLSGKRKIDPRKLSASLRGELDWIVMKALEKDRNRRYESASAFAADVERYLADEPVQACPPSAWYRLRKFARRKKGSIAAAATLGIALLVAVGAVAGSVGWMARERAHRQMQVSTRAGVVLDDVDRLTRERKWSDALAAAKRAETLTAAAEVDEQTRQRVVRVLADLELVRKFEEIRFESFRWNSGLSDHTTTHRAYRRAFSDLGVAPGEMTVEQAARQLRTHAGIQNQLAIALTEWAWHRLGVRDKGRVERIRETRFLLDVANTIDPDRWRRRLRAYLKSSDRPKRALRALAASADVRKMSPSSIVLLGRVLFRRGFPYQGEVEFRERAVELLRQGQLLHPDDFWINYELAHCFVFPYAGEQEKAVSYYRVALAIRPGSESLFRSLGYQLVELKRIDEAIACYKRAIELDSKRYGTYFSLGDALMEQDKVKEAVVKYKRGMKFVPTARSSPYYGRLIRALLKLRKPDEALTWARKHVEQFPKTELSHVNLAHVLHEQKKLNEAIVCYKKAIELRPIAIYLYVGLVTALDEQGKSDEAIAWCRKALQAKIPLDGFAPVQYSMLGGLLYNHNMSSEAAAAHRKAVQIEPRYVAGYVSLGVVLTRQGQLKAAIACFRRALAIDPRYAEAHFRLGYLWEKQGELKLAISAYRRTLELQPKWADVNVTLGNALAKTGDVKAAAAEFRAAVQKMPDSAVTRSGAGAGWYKLKKYDEAAVDFRKAVEIAPRRAAFHFNLGLALRSLKKWKQAVVAYKRATELDSNNATYYHELGNAFYVLRQWPEAETAYREAIRIRGDIPEVQFYLGVVLFCQHKLKEAIPRLRQAAQQRPKDTLRWHWLAMAHYRRRQWDEALSSFRKTTELRPRDAFNWQWLGWAQYQAGDWKGSLASLRKSCQLQKGGKGDAGQWTVMALSHWKLSKQTNLPQKERTRHRAEARRLYDRSVGQLRRWSKRRRPDMREIKLFSGTARTLIAREIKVFSATARTLIAGPVEARKPKRPPQATANN